jgi:hypothetical protein
METEKFERPFFLKDHGKFHELILTKASKEAVDWWVGLMEKLYLHYQTVGIIPILLDLRAGMQPLAYTSLKFGQLHERTPQRPAWRAVILHERDFLIPLVRTTFNRNILGPRDQLRYFSALNRDRAVRWVAGAADKTSTQNLKPIRDEDLPATPPADPPA